MTHSTPPRSSSLSLGPYRQPCPVIELAQRREPNGATIVRSLPRPLGPGFRRVFLRHYDAIRRACSTRPAGVSVVAAGPGDRVIHRWLATAAQPRRLILGRHTRCDLVLAGDGAVSLRHLAVLVTEADGEPRIELIDLRSELGFTDEHGRRRSGLCADGPLFVRCGAYSIFLLPTGGSFAWPASAREAWNQLPPRVYEGPVKPVPRSAASARRSDGNTHVSIRPRPLVLERDRLATGERPLGHLELATTLAGEGVPQRIAIGPTAAATGLLIGRYARCDGGLGHDSLSRVHLLIVALDGELVAVDTASSNGSWRPGDRQVEEVRAVRLSEHPWIFLGMVASLRWRPAR